ncbi:hypothetical protein B9J09_11365 [Xylella fastidiosa subsp. pauca]|nr:hypothetical protein B9J09_11365 [Xylella fastidiosa subsp. pauca]TNW26408.1 hypothetical protein EIP74_08920 [Xylella fastidiosa subsp. pauca]
MGGQGADIGRCYHRSGALPLYCLSGVLGAAVYVWCDGHCLVCWVYTVCGLGGLGVFVVVG